MGRLIEISDENASTVLLTQNWKEPWNRERNYGVLSRKAKKKAFLPDPPVILQPMPDFYRGRFKFHLYNGNTRFRVRSEAHALLHGIVVSSDVEIPQEERVHSLSHSFYFGLLHRLSYHAPLREQNPSYSLEFLIQELERQESLGFLDSMPEYLPPEDPYMDLLLKHFQEKRIT